MTDLIDQAVQVARGAGDIVARSFRSGDAGVSRKGAIDLVTEADHASEAYIKAQIAERFPDHSIVAEESGASGEQGSHRWLVDPLDGTVNFAHGAPHFSVLLAIQERQGDGQYETVASVTLDPMRDELVVARRGQGATLNGKPIRVSKAARLMDALLASGFAYRRLIDGPDNHAEFCRMNLISRGVRRFGSAGLDLAYLACGRFDGFWEYCLNPWDMAAGLLLVEEAGGRVSDLEGGSVDMAVGTLLASNGLLHEPMMKALAAARTLPANARDGIEAFLPDDVAEELRRKASERSS